MHAYNKQRGAALVVALLMLAVMAMLGINSVNNSTVNLRVVYNMQTHQDIEAATQNVIEQTLSSIDPFNSPAATAIETDDGLTIEVDAAVCLAEQPASGYSATFALAPIDTFWDISARGTDTVTGANARMQQGVTIILPAGSCP